MCIIRVFPQTLPQIFVASENHTGGFPRKVLRSWRGATGRTFECPDFYASNRLHGPLGVLRRRMSKWYQRLNTFCLVRSQSVEHCPSYQLKLLASMPCVERPQTSTIETRARNDHSAALHCSRPLFSLLKSVVDFSEPPAVTALSTDSTNVDTYPLRSERRSR